MKFNQVNKNSGDVNNTSDDPSIERVKRIIKGLTVTSGQNVDVLVVNLPDYRVVALPAEVSNNTAYWYGRACQLQSERDQLIAQVNRLRLENSLLRGEMATAEHGGA